MAISMREALDLPVMQEAVLVAGFEGLDRKIQWVTIVEVLEDIDRLQDGEFLITTGYGLTDENKLEKFRTLLGARKLSGIAIYTGFYLSQIPESFIDTANLYHLPLIEIPTHINFSAITKGLLEQIVNRQMQYLKYAASIHNELTDQVVNNRGLSAITKTLANLIEGSVLLLDELLYVKSFYLRDPSVSIQDHVLHLNEDPIPLTSKTEMLNLTSTVQFGVKDQTVMLCPIISNHATYGFIVVIKAQTDWKDIDEIAIKQAATVYTIELLKAKAVEETEVRVQGDFLEKIINKDYENPRIIIERGRKLGHDLTLNQVVFQLKLDDVYQYKSRNELMNRLYHLTYEVLHHIKRHALLRYNLDGLVVLINAEGSQKEINKIAELLIQKWHTYHSTPLLKIGIGTTTNNIADIAKSARQADYALQFRSLVSKTSPIIYYSDLGLYQWLIQMSDANIDLKPFYEECLAPLITDQKLGADFLHTLESYFKQNLNMQKTANTLYIHRHTLKYRLTQIEKKTNLSLSNTEERTRLYLSLLAYKLVHARH